MTQRRRHEKGERTPVHTGTWGCKDCCSNYKKKVEPLKGREGVDLASFRRITDCYMVNNHGKDRAGAELWPASPWTQRWQLKSGYLSDRWACIVREREVNNPRFLAEHVGSQGYGHLRWRRLEKGSSEVHLETHGGEISSSWSDQISTSSGSRPGFKYVSL